MKRFGISLVAALRVGAVVVGLVFIHPASAQTEISPRFRQMFRSHRATVHVDAAGIVRVPLPNEVLQVARPDLEDILLFDSNGTHEIPAFLATDTTRDRRTLAYERELSMRDYRLVRDVAERTSRFVEHFVLELPAPECASSVCAWPEQTVVRLRFATTQAVVHSTVRVLDTNDGQELAHGSVFILPDGRSNLLVPATSGNRSQLRIEVTSLDHALEAHVYAQMEATLEAPLLRTQTLTPTSSHSDGDTRYFVFRNAVPDRAELLLVRNEHDFLFDAQILVQQSAIVRGTLSDYVSAGVPIQRGLVFPSAQEREWTVAIEHFDLPPGSFSFVLTSVRPMMVFQAPHAGEYQLFFGAAVRDRSLRFERVAEQIQEGQSAFQLASLPIGTVQSVAAQTRDMRTIFSEHIRPARAVDTARYRGQRNIVVPDSEAVAARVLLGLYAQAYMQGERDIRVVDASGRQWPFVAAETQVETTYVARMVRTRVELRGSVYRIEIPARTTPTQIEIRVGNFANGRSYTLHARSASSADSDLHVESGRFVAGSATIDFPSGTTADSLELVVDDGDEEPLPLTEAAISYRARELILFAPPGQYRLLAGSDAGPPVYDVEGLRPYLAGLNLPFVRGDNWQSNPDFIRPHDGKNFERNVVWGALIFAVLMLLLMVGVVTQKESGTSHSS